MQEWEYQPVQSAFLVLTFRQGLGFFQTIDTQPPPFLGEGVMPPENLSSMGPPSPVWVSQREPSIKSLLWAERWLRTSQLYSWLISALRPLGKLSNLSLVSTATKQIVPLSRLSLSVCGTQKLLLCQNQPLLILMRQREREKGEAGKRSFAILACASLSI